MVKCSGKAGTRNKKLPFVQKRSQVSQLMPDIDAEADAAKSLASLDKSLGTWESRDRLLLTCKDHPFCMFLACLTCTWPRECFTCSMNGRAMIMNSTQSTTTVWAAYLDVRGEDGCVMLCVQVLGSPDKRCWRHSACTKCAIIRRVNSVEVLHCNLCVGCWLHLSWTPS